MAVVAAQTRVTSGVWRVFILCAQLALVAPPAGAVVIATGDGSGNTTPPADDPGFANVGIVNGLTGIYLGNRWVLTASHVGEHPITLGGITYPAVTGSMRQLQFSPGVTSDVILERIIGHPPLPSLVLSAATPSVSDTVTMIGHGLDRQATQTCWNSNWSEVSCSPFVAFRGYKPLGSQSMRWGSNAVSAVGMDIPLGGTTRAFEVTFDQSGVADEAQAVVGDSGGAVFLKRSGQWQLAGVLFAISTFQNQPVNSSVFGNLTLAVDVAYYKSQIDAIMNPPPQIPALPWPLLPVAGVVLAIYGRRSLTRRSTPR